MTHEFCFSIFKFMFIRRGRILVDILPGGKSLLFIIKNKKNLLFEIPVTFRCSWHVDFFIVELIEYHDGIQ
jgi:hypothetical protein